MRGDQVLDYELLTNIGPVFFPSFDLVETAEKFILMADLPGLSLGDLDIALNSDSITISGEREGENLKDTLSCHALERSFGSFLRTFHLPGGLEPGRLRALMSNGVLTVDVPKHPASFMPADPGELFPAKYDH